MISRLKKLFGSSAAATPRLKPGQPGYHPGVILFVDDEPEVRSIARLSLEQQGYRLIEAEDGQKALELFDKHRAEISFNDNRRANAKPRRFRAFRSCS